MDSRTATASAGALAHRLAFILTVSAAGCSDDPTESPQLQLAAAETGRESAAPNAVVRWNALASELMHDLGFVVDARTFAIMHGAIHDALNGVERRYEPYTADLSSPGASVDVAVATAARDVLIALSPTRHEMIERAYASALDAEPDSRAKEKGVRLGREAARANLERRAGDGIAVGPWPPLTGPITQPTYTPTGEPGDYDFTPPFDQPPFGPAAFFPGLGAFTPYAADLSKHRAPGPDALESEEYAKDVNHLKAIGSMHSRVRTADQTEAAFFWFEEIPIWNQIARKSAIRQGLDTWDAARMFTLLHAAMSDAAIACFAAKYEYRFWRPFTAIRRADEDGNPGTEPDTAWLPLFWPSPGDNPPRFFIPPIPDYPSAAATVSAAAAEVLISTFGDDLSFEATSPSLPGVTRRFDSFSHAADENARSRVYGGIHFVRAIRDGARLGQGIGREVSQLLPREH